MIFYQFKIHRFSVIIRRSYSDQKFGRPTLDQKSGPSLKSDKNHFTVEEVNANFYDYLGVPPDAEKKAINKQYRTLAKVIFI